MRVSASAWSCCVVLVWLYAGDLVRLPHFQQKKIRSADRYLLLDPVMSNRDRGGPRGSCLGVSVAGNIPTGLTSKVEGGPKRDGLVDDPEI